MCVSYEQHPKTAAVNGTSKWSVCVFQLAGSIPVLTGCKFGKIVVQKCMSGAAVCSYNSGTCIVVLLQG
jgi:hypothetical protein